MSNTAPSSADPEVVFPLGRWCPPQETSQPHPPPSGCQGISLHSLAPERFQFNFRLVIFKLILVNGAWGISDEIALRWMPLDLTNDKSTLVQVMAWCHQATSHDMSKCWPLDLCCQMASLGLNELILIIAPALPELLWLPTVWRCPYIEIAFSTLDCSIVPTCGAWCSATAAKRGPLKQSWAEIQHSRDDEPLGVLMQMRNVRVNGFFFFSSLGVLPGVLVDTLSLCSGDFCVECVLIVLHKFYIEL